MSENTKDFQNDSSELQWIKLRKDIGLVDEESIKEKFIRKFKESPLVPIGALATTLCLLFGLQSMRKGRSRHSQLLMRGRILAQGFTVVAIITGLGYTVVDKE
uniref:HIG1 domain-containing protein n=1 Tax=Clastoptera arizonana TaxID=38151 RepID=A0A1B6EH42_9HEMI